MQYTRTNHPKPVLPVVAPGRTRYTHHLLVFGEGDRRGQGMPTREYKCVCDPRPLTPILLVSLVINVAIP